MSALILQRVGLTEIEKSVGLKSVLTWLAWHAHDDGTNAHPGIKRLCRETGLVPRSVRRLLQRAVKDGWLRVSSTRPEHSRVYEFVLEKLAEVQPTAEAKGARGAPFRGGSPASKGSL
jgi:hypothetical protein